MRKDIFSAEVLAKCEMLKSTGVWSNEPKIRPTAWLNNFDDEDKPIASQLLDRFIYFSDEQTNRLLLSAYHALSENKNNAFVENMQNALFTLVTGETPNPTDSGYTICRKVRQLLGVPDAQIVEPEQALKEAKNGRLVIFLDDFVGSGDQFVTTWERTYENENDSFKTVMERSPFKCAYITLVTTDFGLEKINQNAPEVIVSPAHVLTKHSTIHGIELNGVNANQLHAFLEKYGRKLTPQDPYIAQNIPFKLYGWKKRGLLLGFEHSIPDATLPLFWSLGKENWTPLIERC